MRLKFSLRDVSKSYGNLTVLKKCTQSFGPGLNAILGPSQSGKSTLMKICANLEPVSSGKVSYFFSSERTIKNEQYIMRKTTLVMPFGTMFNTSAWKNVISGLVIRKTKRREIKKRANDILNEVGLYEKRNRNAFSLTRGECRRLLLARAVVTNPDILLLDEPFRGLDDESVEIIEKVLINLKTSDDPPTIVMVTSDPLHASGISTKRLVLRNGTFAVSISREEDIDPELDIPGHLDLDQLAIEHEAMEKAEADQSDAGQEDADQDDTDEQEGGEGEPYINPEFFK
jgi:ABC-type multidrug transport system ATPase subunit